MRSALALIDEDVDGGFNVLDTRDGQAIAWRFYLTDAAAIAAMLNASYPVGVVPPARDTLIYEVVEAGIAGEVV
jgi:hypothetical protein